MQAGRVGEGCRRPPEPPACPRLPQALCVKDFTLDLRSCRHLPHRPGAFQRRAAIFLSLSSTLSPRWAQPRPHQVRGGTQGQH